MIIFNTTHTEKADLKEMNRLIGKSFSFFDKLRIGGVGSSRLIIHSVSQNFQSIVNKVSDLSYANIELRPKGIILHITNQLKRFSWVIPYYKLVIFNGEYFSIHSDGSFIQMIKSGNSNINKKFIDKMIDLKNLSNEKFEFVDDY
ncbi:hypothetical protein SAMN04489761_0737 [Tenacibaculum sp. MAR_2009_124]|uniref:hypothetical protein n=1 Tax=Tenacibaculum sp. MAR_2009_124 TaxID=1250059 RepID=UPI00089D08FD|nr:hypothetical protein [Tenacibaculum sp. MAR_2009_124]SEB44167.1 hypothetical protein SAMN04489761_0737 [Tenacibaculum sp. MAR_2009_124]